MKCPKCNYLGLDTGPRCRHCGYEFSLADLTGDGDHGLAADSRLGEGTGRRTPPTPRARPGRHTDAPGMGVERPLARVPDSGPLDLPLFPEDPSGMPLLPTPRPPLAVRRSTPTPARHPKRAARLDDGVFELGLDVPPGTPTPPEVDGPASLPAAEEDAPHVVIHTAAASPVRRVLAAGVDLALLGAIDATVLYFTLRVCELDLTELAALPPVPMAAFFAILNGGYLVLFTGVFGQTLGKMLLGIEVVSADLTPIDLGRACYRAIVSLLSLLTAGLGFLPALVGEGRSLHDRLARTRVVTVRPSHSLT